jgi:hypothetical protein
MAEVPHRLDTASIRVEVHREGDVGVPAGEIGANGSADIWESADTEQVFEGPLLEHREQCSKEGLESFSPQGKLLDALG